MNLKNLIMALDVGESFIVANKDKSRAFRLTLNTVNEPENPRDCAEHMSQMLCWHRIYRIGDANPYKNLHNALVDITKRITSVDHFLDYIRSGSSSNLTLEEASDSIRISDSNKSISLHPSSSSLAELQKFFSDALDMMEDSELFALLSSETDKVVVVPIWMYERSSVILSARIAYPFNYTFNSAAVGFILMEKSVGIKNGMWSDKCPKNIWRKQASEMLEREIAAFSAWQRGNVYSFSVARWVGFELSKDQVISSPEKPIFVVRTDGKKYWGIVNSNPGQKYESKCIIQGLNIFDKIEELGTTWKAFASEELANKKQDTESHIQDGEGFVKYDIAGDTYYGMNREQATLVISFIKHYLFEDSDMSDEEITVEY